MLESIRRFVLKNPIQVGLAVIIAILMALEIIRGGDPIEILLRGWLMP
jgi:hypothetical protein